MEKKEKKRKIKHLNVLVQGPVLMSFQVWTTFPYKSIEMQKQLGAVWCSLEERSISPVNELWKKSKTSQMQPECFWKNSECIH